MLVLDQPSNDHNRNNEFFNTNSILCFSFVQIMLKKWKQNSCNIMKCIALLYISKQVFLFPFFTQLTEILETNKNRWGFFQCPYSVHTYIHVDIIFFFVFWSYWKSSSYDAYKAIHRWLLKSRVAPECPDTDSDRVRLSLNNVNWVHSNIKYNLLTNQLSNFLITFPNMWKYSDWRI